MLDGTPSKKPAGKATRRMKTYILLRRDKNLLAPTGRSRKSLQTAERVGHKQHASDQNVQGCTEELRI
jgi:hypothetical protein